MKTVGRKPIYLKIGDVFGRWEIIGDRISNGERLASYYPCRCKCGVEREVAAGSLINGDSSSCGCFRSEYPSRLDHGKCYTAEHRAWMEMIKRCYNPNSTSFHNIVKQRLSRGWSIERTLTTPLQIQFSKNLRFSSKDVVTAAPTATFQSGISETEGWD